jgi:16S rRNA (cytidine1402-2'-O)-methyltransferase
MVSLREHNEGRETPRLLARLAAGESIALVTDAGTPTISDPGAALVRAAREAGLKVVPIPGPSAVTTALAGSGFPADRFVFMGFAPRSGTAREKWLEDLRREPSTIVFFEAPHRVTHTLEQVRSTTVNRPILAFRELTKIHESSVIYPIDDLPARGEFTIVVGPRPDSIKSEAESSGPDGRTASKVLSFLTAELGVPRAEAEAMTARAMDAGRAQVMKAIKKYIISVKQQKS